MTDWETGGRPRWHLNEWHGLLATLAVMLILAAMVQCGPKSTGEPAPKPTTSGAR